jgi:hypothetical protein
MRQRPVAPSEQPNPNTTGRQLEFARVQKSEVILDTNRNVYLALQPNSPCAVPNDALVGINGRGVIKTQMTLDARIITRQLFARSASTLRLCFAIFAVALFATGIVFLVKSSTFDLDFVISNVDHNFDVDPPIITIADSFTVAVPFVIGTGAILASLPLFTLAILSTNRMADALANRAMSYGLVWIGYAILLAIHSFIILIFNFERFTVRLFGMVMLIVLTTFFNLFMEEEVGMMHNEETGIKTLLSLAANTIATLTYIAYLLWSLILSVQDQETYQWTLTIVSIIFLLLYWALMLAFVLRSTFLVNFRNYVWALKMLIFFDNLIFYWVVFFAA